MQQSMILCEKKLTKTDLKIHKGINFPKNDQKTRKFLPLMCSVLKVWCLQFLENLTISSLLVGARISEVYLITGRILSILPALEQTVARFGHALQLP